MLKEGRKQNEEESLEEQTFWNLIKPKFLFGDKTLNLLLLA